MIGGADVVFWLGQRPDKYSVLFYDGCNVLECARDYRNKVSHQIFGAQEVSRSRLSACLYGPI